MTTTTTSTTTTANSVPAHAPNPNSLWEVDSRTVIGGPVRMSRGPGCTSYPYLFLSNGLRVPMLTKQEVEPFFSIEEYKGPYFLKKE